MNRLTSLLLALLLVSSLAAIPVAANSSTNDTNDFGQLTLQEQTETNSDAEDETTNRLSPEGDVRSEYAEYGADLGTLLASSDDALRSDYNRYTVLDHEFDAADDDERKKMIQAAYDRIKERTTELEERERSAVEAHAAEDLPTIELLQQVLRNHYEAKVLSESLGDIEDRADRIPGYSLSVQDDQNELEMHQTPVRAYLDRAARGETDDGLVAVQTTETGYTISYLDGEYVREATRFDNRNTNRETQFDDITDAYNHASELYPWVFENGRSPTANEHTSVQLYQIQASHDQGQLEAYLDGGTAEVHREVQVLSPTELPAETKKVWVGDGMEVSLTETAGSGPVKLTVTDAATDELVTATVAIDGFELGTTTADGTIWIIPPTETYDLTVETDGSQLEATVLND